MMSGETKRKYTCFIPAIVANDTPTLQTDEMLSPKELLKPLEDSCLYRVSVVAFRYDIPMMRHPSSSLTVIRTLITSISLKHINQVESWWTYEFCYGKHIRQFHQEKDKPVRPQDEFYIGYATADTLASQGELREGYYAQSFSGGTVCDITGQSRKAEVRFVCNNERATSALLDITEPFSCSYHVHVHTPLLCKHPNYRPKQEVVHTIQCALAAPLTAEQRAEQQAKREREQHEEEEKRQWLHEHQFGDAQAERQRRAQEQHEMKLLQTDVVVDEIEVQHYGMLNADGTPQKLTFASVEEAMEKLGVPMHAQQELRQQQQHQTHEEDQIQENEKRKNAQFQPQQPQQPQHHQQHHQQPSQKQTPNRLGKLQAEQVESSGIRQKQQTTSAQPPVTSSSQQPLEKKKSQRM
jgi:hypothetical protein